MNPEIKADWIAALRSGEFKQGRRWLKSSEGFCCLGVLAEVTECLTDGGSIPCSPKPEGCLAYVDKLPPVWMVRQLGLRDEEVLILAKMNDDGKTFSEIADYIEENL